MLPPDIAELAEMALFGEVPTASYEHYRVANQKDAQGGRRGQETLLRTVEGRIRAIRNPRQTEEAGQVKRRADVEFVTRVYSDDLPPGHRFKAGDFLRHNTPSGPLSFKVVATDEGRPEALALVIYCLRLG